MEAVAVTAVETAAVIAVGIVVGAALVVEAAAAIVD